MNVHHAPNAPQSRTSTSQEEQDLAALLKEMADDARHAAAEYLEDSLVREGGE
ncbi:MAG: hypothetical protein AB2A00_33135 [Myxococcota bacterium]